MQKTRLFQNLNHGLRVHYIKHKNKQKNKNKTQNKQTFIAQHRMSDKLYQLTPSSMHISSVNLMVRPITPHMLPVTSTKPATTRTMLHVPCRSMLWRTWTLGRSASPPPTQQANRVSPKLLKYSLFHSSH